jgi:ABC-type antimicrobial peptide transport system permease subunit
VKFIETLKLAVAAIWAHKLRSALTLLGMIVGVTAFVVVVSLIAGIQSLRRRKDRRHRREVVHGPTLQSTRRLQRH